MTPLRRVAWAAALVATATGCDARVSGPCRSEAVARQADGDPRPWAVEVEFAAGQLTVQPGDRRYLYRVEACVAPDEALRVRWDSAAARLRVGTERRAAANEDGAVRVRGRDQQLRLELTPARPLDLRVDLGAAGGLLRLGGLPLRRLAVRGGAAGLTVRFDERNATVADELRLEADAAGVRALGLGSARARRIVVDAELAGVDLDFRGDWAGAPPQTIVEVQAALAGVTVRLPRRSDLGVELRSRASLGGVQAPGLRREGSVLRSPNWATAAHRLIIDARAELGGVRLLWEEGGAPTRS